MPGTMCTFLPGDTQCLSRESGALRKPLTSRKIPATQKDKLVPASVVARGGRNRIGKREKWPKQSWEEGEIGGKSREEGEKERLTFREEGEIGSKSREGAEIGSESREKGDLPPCSSPL